MIDGLRAQCPRLHVPQPADRPAITPLPRAGEDPQVPQDCTGRVLLRVLATTDLHAQILSHDYFTNRPQFGQGLAQIACLIDAARAEVAGSLLLDNGDFLQGSVLSEIAAEPGRRRPHPAVAAMNVLGYDAAALGNHEFDYGLPLLDRARAAAAFPVLSANIAHALADDPVQDRLYAPPYALIHRDLADGRGDRHRLCIGVLALTPPQVTVWCAHHLRDRLTARAPVEAAKAWLPELRRAGADVVICLVHGGHAPPDSAADAENYAGEIAALPGVDAVIAGHSHLVWPPSPRLDRPGPLAPVVEPGHSGSHLGLLDLALEPPASPGQPWRILSIHSRAMGASEVVAGLPLHHLRRVAEPLRRAIGSDHRAALAWMRQVVGNTPHALHNYFATLHASRAQTRVAQAMARHATRQLADGRWRDLPVLAAVTPYRSGGRGGPRNFTDIAPGPLTMRHVLDLYPYPNTLLATVITGAGLAARLERAAGLFRTLVPGHHDQPLHDPTVPAFSFEIIPGLSYRIDPTAPPLPGGPRPLGGGRIRDLRWQGRALDPDQRFVLVTNSHLGAGLHDSGATVVLDDPARCFDILAADLRTGHPPDPDPPGWRLEPLPGTSVTLDSGPGALHHMAEISHFRPELLGLTPEGFHRFRLWL